MAIDYSIPATTILQQVLQNNGYTLAGIFLMITAFLIALAFMIARIFQSKKLESWAVNEAFQSLASAGILYFSVGILFMFGTLMGTFFIALSDQKPALPEVSYLMKEIQTACSNNQQGCTDIHLIGARAYLTSRLDKLQDIYDYVFYTYAISGSLGTFQANFPEKAKTPFMLGFASKIAEYVQSLLEYLFYGFFFIYMQLALLDFIKAYFVYGFTSGIALRAFPFTRSLGSFLIASALGLYFVYPFFLTLMLLMNYEDLNITPNQILNIAKNEYPGVYLNYYIERTLMHQQFYSGASAANTPSIEPSTIKELGSIIRFLLLTMILYPLVCFVITYTFIHQTAELMQANISDLGRGLVRLI